MADPIRVLIADEMSKKAVEILSNAGFSVEVKTGMKPEELAAVIGQYHGVGVRSASKITAAVLANPGKLKIIGRAGVGVDNDRNVRCGAHPAHALDDLGAADEADVRQAEVVCGKRVPTVVEGLDTGTFRDPRRESVVRAEGDDRTRLRQSGS